jgi:hypothetical protein
MKPLTIGQLARRAGVGVETVRFYERLALLEELAPVQAKRISPHRPRAIRLSRNNPCRDRTAVGGSDRRCVNLSQNTGGRPRLRSVLSCPIFGGRKGLVDRKCKRLRSCTAPRVGRGEANRCSA